MSIIKEKIEILRNKPEENWTEEDYSTGLFYVIGTLVFIGLLIALPFGLVFSFNTLFGTTMAYTFGTWFSIYFMFFIVKLVLIMISKRIKGYVA